jgi:hypothetical protein
MDDRRRRFEAQVLPHLDAAYRFARWLSHAPTDADDIVQEAVLRAFRGFDGLRGSDVKVATEDCEELLFDSAEATTAARFCAAG